MSGASSPRIFVTNRSGTPHRVVPLVDELEVQQGIHLTLVNGVMVLWCLQSKPSRRLSVGNAAIFRFRLPLENSGQGRFKVALQPCGGHAGTFCQCRD